MTVEAGGNMPQTLRGSKGLRVFISYSRLDLAFVDHLQEALQERGIEASIDREDIEKGEAWWARIQQLITEADTVLFVLSPDSILSPVCQQEVDFAESLNKRFIPVVARDIADLAVPPALSRLNYVFFVPHAGAPGNFDTAVDELSGALENNLVWIREHTRLGTVARRWEGRQRPKDLLLRGGELTTAETWLTSRPPNAPDPTDAHRAFVAESRRVAIHRQRRALLLSLFAVAVSLSLAAVAYLKQVEAQQTLATSDFTNGTRLFLDPSTRHEGLRLLARAANAEDRERALIRLAAAAQQNVFWVKGPKPNQAAAESGPTLPPQYTRFTIDGKSFRTISHAISADGRRIAISASDGETHPDIRVAVFDKAQQIVNWFVPKAESEQWLYDIDVTLSPDGRFLATERQDWRSPSYIHVYDMSRKKLIGQPIRATGNISAYQQRGFGVIKFLSNQPFGYTEGTQRYLLIGSERGDAAIYYVDETKNQLLFKHQHEDIVVAAAIGGKPGEELFVSFDAAFTGKISGVNRSTTIHPDIQAEFAPERIRIAPDGGSISLFGADGETAQFQLVAPSKQNPILGKVARDKSSADATGKLKKPYCGWPKKNGATANEETSKRAKEFLATRDRALTFEGRRLSLSDAKGVMIASQDFPWPIAAVCTTDRFDYFAIAFENLDVEIWRSDLSERVGTRIKQLSFFKGSRRPDQFISAQIAEDAHMVLTVTHFWNPPNLGFYWIRLYDVATGLPLTKSIRFVDEETDFGILSGDGSRIALGSGHFDDTFKELSEFRLRPSPEAKSRLISHMDRIAQRLPPETAP